MSHWADILKLTVTLLAIVDPIASIPVFLTTTDGESNIQRARIARIVAITVFCVLGVAALIGTEILHFFGISIPSFLIGGGIVLMMMSISMLQAKESRIRQTPDEAEEAAEKHAVAVVPLGIPVLAGPGASSTRVISRPTSRWWKARRAKRWRKPLTSSHPSTWSACIAGGTPTATSPTCASPLPAGWARTTPSAPWIRESSGCYG